MAGWVTGGGCFWWSQVVDFCERVDTLFGLPDLSESQVGFKQVGAPNLQHFVFLEMQ